MDARGRGGWSLRQLETAGAFAVIVTGALLHFAYGWSGGSRVVAAIAPANESVWEHLKMVLVPALGVHSNVAVDILSFLAAIAGGQWLSYRFISGRRRPAPLATSATALVLLAVGLVGIMYSSRST